MQAYTNTPLAQATRPAGQPASHCAADGWQWKADLSQASLQGSILATDPVMSGKWHRRQQSQKGSRRQLRRTCPSPTTVATQGWRRAPGAAAGFAPHGIRARRRARTAARLAGIACDGREPHWFAGSAGALACTLQLLRRLGPGEGRTCLDEWRGQDRR